MAIAAACIAAVPAELTAQVVRIGFVAPAVRDSVLGAAYDTRVGALERAWCVTSYRVSAGIVTERTAKGVGRPSVDSVFLVDSVAPGKAIIALPTGIVFWCGEGVPPVHTHPAHTCAKRADPASCGAGGWLAYQCGPSRQDYEHLAGHRAPFGIIVCGPNQARFFFLADYLDEPPLEQPRAPIDVAPSLSPDSARRHR